VADSPGARGTDSSVTRSGSAPPTDMPSQWSGWVVIDLGPSSVNSRWRTLRTRSSSGSDPSLLRSKEASSTSELRARSRTETRKLPAKGGTRTAAARATGRQTPDWPSTLAQLVPAGQVAVAVSQGSRQARW
jgi:hypothetical protein